MAASLYSGARRGSNGATKSYMLVCRTAVYISHFLDGLQDGGGQSVW